MRLPSHFLQRELHQTLNGYHLCTDDLFFGEDLNFLSSNQLLKVLVNIKSQHDTNATLNDWLGSKTASDTSSTRHSMAAASSPQPPAVSHYALGDTLYEVPAGTSMRDLLLRYPPHQYSVARALLPPGSGKPHRKEAKNSDLHCQRLFQSLFSFSRDVWS